MAPPSNLPRLSFVDSHTGGEPTRVITGGFPALPGASLAEQRSAFSRDFDHWRSLINNEPRGHEVLVSAVLVEPKAPDCAAGVLFFNDAGMLGMCGHGTIGVIATLAYLGQLGPGVHRLDTPVGVVSATLHGDGRVSVANVAARRYRAGVNVNVPGLGEVRGDVAWGGNWFFLVDAGSRTLDLTQLAALEDETRRIQDALNAQGVTGEGGAPIDHIELFAHSGTPGVDARNYVRCPGGAYDRSPCGTGTSAKLACLAADGQLAPGQRWVQESVIGSTFEASYELISGEVRPTITGRAFITAEGTILAQEGDPYAWGIGVGAGAIGG